MNKEYIKILDDELNKRGLRDNTKRCYKNSFKRFISNKDNDILNKLNSIKNKTELSQVVNSIRMIHEANSNIEIISEEDLKTIIRNKKKNKHKSYEPYHLDDALKRINKIRDEKYKLGYRLMLRSGLRVFELSNLTKGDIEINNDEIIVTIIDGKGGKYGEVKCLEDKYLSKKLKVFLDNKSSKEKLFYSEISMQKKAQELGFKCHDLRRAYAKIVKKEVLKEAVEFNEEQKAKLVEERVKLALRHSKFETSKKYLYSKRIKV